MKKVIIAGSRSFNNYKLLKETCDELLSNEFQIISGTANGADKLGEVYAKENNLELLRFPADWNTYGKGAGYIRNKQMAENATHCLCFWDSKSKGTKHMIDLANQFKLKLKIINYE